MTPRGGKLRQNFLTIFGVKNQNDGAIPGQKSFMMGLAVSPQYRRVTDRQTDTARRHRPRYAERRAGKKEPSVKEVVFCLCVFVCQQDNLRSLGQILVIFWRGEV